SQYPERQEGCLVEAPAVEQMPYAIAEDRYQRQPSQRTNRKKRSHADHRCNSRARPSGGGRPGKLWLEQHRKRGSRVCHRKGEVHECAESSSAVDTEKCAGEKVEYVSGHPDHERRSERPSPVDPMTSRGVLKQRGSGPERGAHLCQ